MEKGSNDPMCALKVDLKCCSACPMKIKRKLLRLSGVYAVVIDKEEGLVKVSGRENLDPSILIKTVAKAGKVAELCSFEKINPNAADQPNNLSDNARDCCNSKSSRPDGMERHDSGSHSDVKDGEKVKKKKKGKGKAKAEEEDSCKNGDNPPRADGRTSGHFPHHHSRYGKIHVNEAAPINPPVAPPHRSRPFMRPPSQFGTVSVYGNQRFWPRISDSLPPPMVPMRPAYSYYRPESPPMPPTYYYQQQQAPVGNAPGHYLFSDENIDGCVIV